MLIQQLTTPPSLPPATALTDLDTTTINKLLTALNECTEWGQVFILDSLATYQVRPQSFLKHHGYVLCLLSVGLCCWKIVSSFMHLPSFFFFFLVAEG